MSKSFAATSLALVLLTAACGNADDTRASGERMDAVVTAPAGSDKAAAADVPATGTIIEVEMVTDGAGNYFEPSEIDARPGDVIRFVLVSGVHNVSFPEERNQGLGRLPEASPYLQLPGQTYDLKVDVGPGEYFFQCDPHAALGMIGTLRVADD